MRNRLSVIESFCIQKRTEIDKKNQIKMRFICYSIACEKINDNFYHKELWI